METMIMEMFLSTLMHIFGGVLKMYFFSFKFLKILMVSDKIRHWNSKNSINKTHYNVAMYQSYTLAFITLQQLLEI